MLLRHIASFMVYFELENFAVSGSLIRSIQLTSTAYRNSPTCRNAHGTDSTLTEGDLSLIVDTLQKISVILSLNLNAWPPHCTLFAVCSRLSAWLVNKKAPKLKLPQPLQSPFCSTTANKHILQIRTHTHSCIICILTAS